MVGLPITRRVTPWGPDLWRHNHPAASGQAKRRIEAVPRRPRGWLLPAPFL